MIFTEDVERIFGPRKWVSRTEELFGPEKKDDAKGPTPPPIDDVDAVEVTAEDSAKADSSKGDSEKDAAAPKEEKKE